MKRKYFAMTISLAMVFILAISYIVANSIEKDSTKNNSNLLLLASGTNSIYGNITQVGNITNGSVNNIWYSYIEYKKYNETEIKTIAEKFINNAKIDTDYSGSYSKYINKTANEELFIDSNNYIHFINNEYIDNSYQRSELLNENKIVEKAKELIKKFRGNTTDLSLVEYYTPVNHKGEVENTNMTSNSTIIGYGNQVVIFNQIVNGRNITGAKGKLLLRLGPNGKLVDYIDKTIRINTIKTYNGSKIKTLAQSLDVLANRSISYSEDEYILKNWEYVYYFPTSNINKAYLHYKIDLQGRNQGGEYQNFIDAMYG